MVHKVYISTTRNEHTDDYDKAIKSALWQMREFLAAPIPLDDISAGLAGNLPQLNRQVIESSDIFIGVYGENADASGRTTARLETEYNYAVEHGLKSLIFMPAHTTSNEERLEAFKDSLRHNYIVHEFDSLDDLQSKTILALSNYKKTMYDDRRIKPPLPRFLVREEVAEEQTSESFEEQVERALGIAEDGIEGIIRRALAVHDAEQKVNLTAPETDEDEMTIRPIFGAPSTRSQFQADIFMIMPFRPEYDSIYQNIIKPVCAELNLTIKRGDDFSSLAGVIINEVWAAIAACKLVIVETTEDNANVFYELGMAHTLGKPAILLTQAQDADELPFDIRHLRFIIYENTIPGGEKLEANLKRSIVWILNDLGEMQG